MDIEERYDEDVVRNVRRIMKLYTTMEDGEVEARIGNYNNQKPSVSKDVFDKLHENVRRGCPSPAPWIEFHDYFYEHEGATIRTRVLFDTNKMCLSTSSIQKKLVESCTFNSNERELQMRIKLSRESKYNGKLPTCVDPFRVCIVRRCSFVFPDERSPVWSFDFSTVHAGENRLSVEEKACSEDPEYHIECEIVKQQYVQNDHEHAARSMIHKMQVLTGCRFVGSS